MVVDARLERMAARSVMRTTLLVAALACAILSLGAWLLIGQMVKPVEDAFERQKQFVWDASHEFKTPLAVISANAEVLAGEIGKHSEADTAAYRAKFEARLKGLLADNMAELNPNMVLTECAIYADRVAIDEELVRLSCHFEAFRTILASDEPVGRKLDFLLQEINRETNTIGSKACDVAIAKIVVEIKSELEKIREQIQNIE
jgi:uncharacterized protein (TIGR00255 family)